MVPLVLGSNREGSRRAATQKASASACVLRLVFVPALVFTFHRPSGLSTHQTSPSDLRMGMVSMWVFPRGLANLLRLPTLRVASEEFRRGESLVVPPNQFERIFPISHLRPWKIQLFFAYVYAHIPRVLLPDQHRQRGSFEQRIERHNLFLCVFLA